MNRIERMLQELCPEGVEYMKLIDVAEILYGYPFDAKLFTKDNQYIPLIRIRDVKSAKASTYYKGDFNDIYIIKRGDILVGMDGNFNLEKWNDRNGVLNQRVCKIYAKNQLVVINEYLYHLLGPIFKKIEEEVKGGTVKHLSAAKINRIEIPVPPLPIQEEIVRILDHFTELTASLQAELQARQEQYEYYRNKLLTFDAGSVTWMKMSEICLSIASGGTPNTSKKEYYIGDIPWLRTQEVDWRDIFDTGIKISKEGLEKSSAKMIPKNCVIIAMYGATAAKVAINKIPLCTNQACCNLEINPQKAYYRFVYQWICKEYKNLKAKGEGSQNNINSKKIKNYLIPIPPLSEQQRIVDILDQFETLVNDLSQGLPAEIAAVQEQYEYYRNKLLTFNRIKLN